MRIFRPSRPPFAVLVVGMLGRYPTPPDCEFTTIELNSEAYVAMLRELRELYGRCWLAGRPPKPGAEA